MQDGRKAAWSIPYVSVAFSPSLKQYFIAYRSSKVSSRPDCIFEIHQLWQSDFSRVYSNSYCSCSFEAEIIKAGQSSHKMYSSNILHFQVSTTILNACKKKARNLLNVPRTWLDGQKKDHINKKNNKKKNKGTAPNNYRPITCLPVMWKILTAQIREEIYYSLTSRGLFPEEQKLCRKGSRGTAELLYIDQHILSESKTRRKNLAMAWIYNKKAYDMVPQSWIIKCLKL